MAGPPGVELVAAVGVTDRGVLWRASRQRPNDRIVRVLEPRFADGAFRRAVANLARRRPAGMVEVTGHDWTTDGRYYVEYAVDAGWRTLAERLTELADWQDRITLLTRVCSLFPQWQRSPVHPIGLNPHTVVVVPEEDHWLPWLVPCPPVTPATPCDLFGVDVPSIAALAPEVVRGLQPDPKAVDSYALGTLVAQVLGDDGAPPAVDDESRVEAQARGTLWPPLAAGTRLPATLSETQAGEDLFRAVEHYRQTAPSARPADAAELRLALAAVADPVSVARQLRESDPVRAIEALQCFRVRDVDTRIRACLLGAEIAADLGDDEAVLRYLDEAVALDPRRHDVRRRRYDAAWRVFAPLPPGHRGDQLGRVILEDADVLAKAMPEDDPTVHHRAAEVLLRRGDPAAAARRLYPVVEHDPSDLESLWLYCRCWRELDDGNSARIRAEAYRRIDRMAEAEMHTKGEAEQWYERFARLFS